MKSLSTNTHKSKILLFKTRPRNKTKQKRSLIFPVLMSSFLKKEFSGASCHSQPSCVQQRLLTALPISLDFTDLRSPICLASGASSPVSDSRSFSNQTTGAGSSFSLSSILLQVYPHSASSSGTFCSHLYYLLNIYQALCEVL